MALLLLLASAAGAWQQRVAYIIRARLVEGENTEHRIQNTGPMLRGTERLWYWNNSPDTLKLIWLHLYPNACRDRTTAFAQDLERMQNYEFSFAAKQDLGWLNINRIEFPLAGDRERTEPQTNADERGPESGGLSTKTVMRAQLPAPLKPGDSTCLDLDFVVKIPASFSQIRHEGRQYFASQWYPKAAVYDEKGWHADDYRAIGGFYGDYGSFDVEITLPSNLAVGATGELTGCTYVGDTMPTRVPSPPDSEYAWMKRAPSSRNAERGMKTLQFHAANVNDFGWVASPDFILMDDTTNIAVLVPAKQRKEWQSVLGHTRKALDYYREHYGPCPYTQITVTEAGFADGSELTAPGLVVLSSAPLPFTRMLERSVVRGIGSQWFREALGPNEMAEPWLAEGFRTFAETRYFEENYGRPGSLMNAATWPHWLPALDESYYQQLQYGIAVANGLLRPLLTPAAEFVAEPAAYAGVVCAEGAAVVDMLRRIVGDSCLDRIMRTYCARFRYGHPTTGDFIRTAEEVSGRDLRWFFDQWLRTTGTCDYAVAGVRQQPGEGIVDVRRLGELRMPVDVSATFRDGSTETRTWNGDSTFGRLHFLNSSRLRSVTLDPDEKLLEVNRWNNRWPPAIEFGPLINRPSFDRYQIFWGPYLWYGSYQGVQFGPWLMGRELIDAGPLRGRHAWAAKLVYFTRTNVLDVSASYSTPLSLISDRLKLGVGGEYSVFGRFANAGLTWHAGRAAGPSGLDLGFGYVYSEFDSARGLSPRDYLDKRDWVGGRVGKLQTSARHQYAARCWQGSEELRLAVAAPQLGSDSTFSRVSVELRQTWRPIRDLRVELRFFGGYDGGSPPPQEQYFLSGNLYGTPDEPLTWPAWDLASTQSHWHINGEANLRGYITGHIRGKYAAALNLGLPSRYVAPFFDIGNVGNSVAVFAPASLRMDAGLRLQYGPIYADFPIWANRPLEGSPLAFRWMLGLRISGLGNLF